MSRRCYVWTRTRSNQFVRLRRAVDNHRRDPRQTAAQAVAKLLTTLEVTNRRDTGLGEQDMGSVDGRDPLFGQPVREVLDEARDITAAAEGRAA